MITITTEAIKIETLTATQRRLLAELAELIPTDPITPYGRSAKETALYLLIQDFGLSAMMFRVFTAYRNHRLLTLAGLPWSELSAEVEKDESMTARIAAEVFEHFGKTTRQDKKR